MDGIKIEYLPLKDLKAYENNARKHGDEDLQAIMNSIKEFGFNDPIGIWSDQNIIVEGHGRLIAAKKLKMDKVPCIRLDHMTDEQRRAYTLAHNKTAELSAWDFDMVDLEIENIADIDMTQFGFELEFEQVTDEKEPKAKTPSEKLPESKIYIFGISAFGTDSECFAEIKLTDEEAEKLAAKMNERGAQAIADEVRRLVNEL